MKESRRRKESEGGSEMKFETTGLVTHCCQRSHPSSRRLTRPFSPASTRARTSADREPEPSQSGQDREKQLTVTYLPPSKYLLPPFSRPLQLVKAVCEESCLFSGASACVAATALWHLSRRLTTVFARTRQPSCNRQTTGSGCCVCHHSSARSVW